ncbi:hypothetical protein EXW10_05990 [Enterococcus faecium]|uniref:Uncharacterized protein n=1 Tax=Enterococcus faecalis TaxID=1351 RepID=A0A3N3ZB12_ENTFL|nr:hypothetical protein [Enterococcus faecium]ROY52962.1 hypothetical protein EGW70_03410 [Enterococcus faecalis]EGP5210844.1 hypothetical protein [Enterococcus faecium]EGP5274060.1 hypothetical protein [Enterococcus faecium]EGP5651431.1 hypothetical protein [Enterococcus faecium]
MYKREKSNKIVYMNILIFLLSMKKHFNFLFFVSTYSINASLTHTNRSTASTAALLLFSSFVS